MRPENKFALHRCSAANCLRRIAAASPAGAATDSYHAAFHRLERAELFRGLLARHLGRSVSDHDQVTAAENM